MNLNYFGNSVASLGSVHPVSNEQWMQHQQALDTMRIWNYYPNNISYMWSKQIVFGVTLLQHQLNVTECTQSVSCDWTCRHSICESFELSEPVLRLHRVWRPLFQQNSCIDTPMSRQCACPIGHWLEVFWGVLCPGWRAQLMRLVTFRTRLSPPSSCSPRWFSYKLVASPLFSFRVVSFAGFYLCFCRNVAFALPLFSDFLIIVSPLPYCFFVTHYNPPSWFASVLSSCWVFFVMVQVYWFWILMVRWTFVRSLVTSC